MNLKKKNDPTSLIYIVIAIAAAFACRIAEFFKSPDANLKIIDFIHQLIEFFEALGICAGLVILFLVCVSIYAHFDRVISDAAFNRILRQSREYPVRCYPVTMNKSEYGLLPEDFSKESGQETRVAIYFNVTITNHGVCITAKSETHIEEKITPDSGFPFGLFIRDWSNPVFIPISCINLFHIIRKYEGGLVYELAPTNSEGYTGKLPIISSGDQLEIVVLFECFLQGSNLKKIESVDQALMLKMVVLNDNGDHDAVAAYELYKIIYEGIKSIPPDDDDSWMYRSRPTFYW